MIHLKVWSVYSKNSVRAVHVGKIWSWLNHYQHIQMIGERVTMHSVCMCEYVGVCVWGVLLFFIFLRGAFASCPAPTPLPGRPHAAFSPTSRSPESLGLSKNRTSSQMIKSVCSSCCKCCGDMGRGSLVLSMHECSEVFLEKPGSGTPRKKPKWLTLWKTKPAFSSNTPNLRSIPSSVLQQTPDRGATAGWDC